MTWYLKLFYDSVLLTLTILYCPKYLWDMVNLKKYRKSFLFRVGLKFPQFKLKQKAVIWIHAASLGETKAALSVCKDLKTNYPDHAIVFSNVTETGFAEAKFNNPYVDYNFYLPIDYSLLMRKLVKKINPKLFIVVEAEFWPNLFSELKKNNSKIALINGRISERSYTRFKNFPFLLRYFFGPIDLLCVQNEAYKTRFLSAGVDESKIVVTGNIKFDNQTKILDSKSLSDFKRKLGLLPQHRVITIGSSHQGEEKKLLESLSKLLSQDRNLKVILVPRHPERFTEVENLLKSFSFHYVKYSNIDLNDRCEKVILLDQMGMLNQCYQVSDIAIVGGSFEKVGGHNLVEPVQFSVPTFYGPHTFNQFELSSLLKAHDVGFETSVENIRAHIQDLLYNEKKRLNYEKKAKAFISSFKGSSKVTFKKLSEILNF